MHNRDEQPSRLSQPLKSSSFDGMRQWLTSVADLEGDGKIVTTKGLFAIMSKTLEAVDREVANEVHFPGHVEF